MTDDLFVRRIEGAVEDAHRLARQEGLRPYLLDLLRLKIAQIEQETLDALHDPNLVPLDPSADPADHFGG